MPDQSPHPHLAAAPDGAAWHPAAWREPGARPGQLFTAGYWADLVAEAEHGLLDLVTMEDSLSVQPEAFDGPDWRVDRVRGCLDAVLIAARIAPLSRHIGPVPVAVVTHTEPFHLDRDRLRYIDFAGRWIPCWYRGASRGPVGAVAGRDGRRRADPHHDHTRPRGPDPFLRTDREGVAAAGIPAVTDQVRRHAMGRPSTVVVGGGCSGVLAAVQLLRHGTGRVTMVEPDATLGAGVAYRTPVAAHVLNSRAATMSGDPDDPEHFLAWTRRSGIPLRPAGFAVRHDYGRYLHDLLDAAAVDNPGRFTHIRGRVTRLGLSGDARVVTDRGAVLRADQVVLAIGHCSPNRPRQLSESAACHPGYVADPWRPGALDAIPFDRPVLLVGTGLTAVDVALALQIRGMRAPIHAVSRHGLLPLVHTVEPTAATLALSPTAGPLASLIRQVRLAASRCADWRDVVDGTRPSVNALWAGLSLADRDRFLRHAYRYWEVHRHRMAPSVAVVVGGMLADGALRTHAANLSAVTAEAGQLLVEARSGARWRVGTVVNCTGRGSAARSALGRRLLADGHARRDPLGVGVDVDADGRLVSATGRGDDRILVIGSLRRGQWWETDAVPEIRAQARKLLRVPAPLPRIAA